EALRCAGATAAERSLPARAPSNRFPRIRTCRMSVATKSSEAKATKARVLLVDDHPIVRQGLGQLINEEADLSVVSEAEDFQQALSALESTPVDVAIVDISLKERSGIELIKEIRARKPDLPILVLSMHDESLHAERVLRAGAKGYIMKQEA